MHRLLGFARSSVGAKVLMALSGLVMVGFLVGHMAGNLLVFWGSDALNSYAASLHSMPVLLWGVRVGLLAALITHLSVAIMLTRRNRLSGGDHKQVTSSQSDSVASMNMALTGMLVFLYIVYHLAHFTFQWTGPQEVYAEERNVYAMVVGSFQNVWISGVYLLAMLVMGLHLFHGVCSVWSSLGLHHSVYTPLVRVMARALSIVLVVGFSAVPLAVLFGWVV